MNEWEKPETYEKLAASTTALIKSAAMLKTAWGRLKGKRKADEEDLEKLVELVAAMIATQQMAIDVSGSVIKVLTKHRDTTRRHTSLIVALIARVKALEAAAEKAKTLKLKRQRKTSKLHP